MTSATGREDLLLPFVFVLAALLILPPAAAETTWLRRWGTTSVENLDPFPLPLNSSTLKVSDGYEVEVLLEASLYQYHKHIHDHEVNFRSAVSVYVEGDATLESVNLRVRKDGDWTSVDQRILFTFLGELPDWHSKSTAGLYTDAREEDEKAPAKWCGDPAANLEDGVVHHGQAYARWHLDPTEPEELVALTIEAEANLRASEGSVAVTPPPLSLVLYVEGYEGEASQPPPRNLLHLDDENLQRFEFVECPAFPPLLALLLQGGLVAGLSAGVVYYAWRRKSKEENSSDDDTDTSRSYPTQRTRLRVTARPQILLFPESN